MAHNLELKADGTYSFVSSKNMKAWHGLGTYLPDEFLTAEQCIQYANLGYTVEKKPVFMELGTNNFLQVPDKFATYRTDTNDIFGVVGKKYTIIQNTDAFGFFDSIVGEGAAIYETAGVLLKGETVFISAKLHEFCHIKGTDDITEMYVLLKMSHDGSGSIMAMLTPIRVVCNNTLNAAIAGTKNCVKITHTKNAEMRLKQAGELLGITNKYVTEFNEVLNQLAKVKVSDAWVNNLLTELFPSAKDEVSTKASNIRIAALESYHNGIGQSGIVGTAYGVYNGITYYLNHAKGYGNPDKDLAKSEAIKFDSLFGGNAYNTQQQCFDKLVSLI